MVLDAPRPPATPLPTATRTRRPWRLLAATALAGGALAAVVAVPVTLGVARTDAPATTSASTTTTVPAFVPGRRSGQTTPRLPDDGGTSRTDAGTTDATEAQSQGLVLIDTVLPDGEAAGTGMVLDADGLVLTNYHVVEGSTSVRVTVATTGDTYAATVVGRDATADVAVLQLDDASDLTTVTLDDDGDPAVGSIVTAIGNAEGQGYLSAAPGTVEALGRSITTGDEGAVDGEQLTDLVQTDAAVVGGYSGGALLDAEGEVVAMTTAASTGLDPTGAAESYAVPIDDALEVVAVVESGSETATTQVGASPYLGVSVGQDLTVAAVEAGSPAADAGLAAGGRITAVDGTPLTTYDDLSAVLATLEPGDRTTLAWTDATGAGQQGEVVLGASPLS